MNRLLLAASAAIALTSAASADVLQEKNMPLDIAAEIAQSAVVACAADGYNVAAAVVDRAGVVRALLRGDNAGPHTVSAATQKASDVTASFMSVRAGGLGQQQSSPFIEFSSQAG